MSQQSRLTDLTLGTGTHGLPCCPHVLTGIRITGSPDVLTNGLGASRAYADLALHSCPHCAVNLCMQGSPDVLTNGYPAHRVGDAVTEFCGWGQTVTGSPDVFTNGG